MMKKLRVPVAALLVGVIAAVVVTTSVPHLVERGLRSIGLIAEEPVYSQYNPDLNLLTLNRPTPAPVDTLGSSELLSRMSRLYQYQAALMKARANGEEKRVGTLIDQAMREMKGLMNQPDITERDRFQQLYRTFAGEYRSYYGVPDTLSAVQGAISEVRAGLFAAVEQASRTPGPGRKPQLAEAMRKELVPQQTDVPMPLNGLTRAGLRFLQRAPEDHVYRWMARKETYFPMIEHVFAEEGVPDELKYLALVESGLVPRSESVVGAAGMWQFMPATGRAYGLDINAWVDERLDPEKATRAAARHLKDLHRLFDGDWLLALSGYNCSPTRIRQAIRKAERYMDRKPTFWDIYEYLPQETRNYVPTYVAAALMLSNPQAFDLKHVPPGPRYRFDRIPVRGAFSVETLAEFANTNPDKIRALNPSLRKDRLPPSDGAFSVRLPYGTHGEFLAAYEQLSAAQKRSKKIHHVRAGETLAGMAARYGVTVEALREANSLEKDRRIGPDDDLLVPLKNYQKGEALLAATGRALESVQYSARTLRPLAPTGATLAGRGKTSAGTTRAKNAAQTVATHNVEKGETLYSIAQEYDVSVTQLRQWNDLPSNNLEPGQRLKVTS